MCREKNGTRYIIKKRNDRYSEDENMDENMSKTHLFSAATFLESILEEKKKNTSGGYTSYFSGKKNFH